MQGRQRRHLISGVSGVFVSVWVYVWVPMLVCVCVCVCVCVGVGGVHIQHAFEGLRLLVLDTGSRDHNNRGIC